jgi:hypothetical membrane protein
MSGSALFVVVFTLDGLMRPGYQPSAQYVSELALGPRGWVQTLNFLVSGSLIVAFAWGLAPLRQMGRTGPILVALIGLALLLSGFFVMDPFELPRAEWTVHGTVHQLLGALAFTLMPTVCIVLAWRWRHSAEWRAFRAWTIAIVVVLLSALVLLRVGPASPPAAPTVFNPWRGLIQRGILIPFMLWLFTLAAAIGRGAGITRLTRHRAYTTEEEP